MRVPAIWAILCLGIAGISCNDGSATVAGKGTGGANGSGGNATSSGGSVGSGGSAVTGTGGASSGTGGASGSEGETGTGGTSGTGGTVGTGSGGASAGTGGASVGTGGTTATGGAGGSADGLRSGPFKMLVLSKCEEYKHLSIGTGQDMLRMLGQKKDAELPKGAQPGSQFTVTIAKDDLSDFTDANLKNYEIIFWMSPTGAVFSLGGANGAAGKLAVQNFMEKNQGAWGGIHSATDFEKTSMWTWFQNLVGGYFVSHDSPGTNGTLVVQPALITADHPIIRGLKTPYSAGEEWYRMNRNPETLAGYTIVQKLASDSRPITWIHELSGGGRTFYTARGHDSKTYAEVEFQNLVHQGILWAVHRMK